MFQHGDSFAANMPPMIDGQDGLSVVEAETNQFSGSLLPYALGIATKASLAKVEFTARRFEIMELSDYEKLYGTFFKIPGVMKSGNGVHEKYLSDAFFSRSRHLYYSTFIEAVRDRLPFPLTDADVHGLLPSGETLETALKAGKLYMEDHIKVDFLAEHVIPGKTMPFTIALFYRTEKEGLKVLAIAMTKTLVVGPKDGAAWTLAKIAANTACFVRAVMGDHFIDHFAMVPLTTGYYRTLASNHPIRVILAHVLRQNLGIISLGSRTLLAPRTGYFDRYSAIGRNGTIALMQKIYSTEYSFFRSEPDEEIKRRGLEGMMNDFTYFSISKMYYDVYNRLMKDLVSVYYATDAAVEADVELQHFAKDVSGVAKLKGFPNKFSGRDDLARTLAHIYYVVSVRHAVVGTLGLDWTAMLPSSALSLYRPMPKTKEEVTEENIVSWLPNISAAIGETQLMFRFGRPVKASENVENAFKAISAIDLQGLRSPRTQCIFDKYAADLERIKSAVLDAAQNDPVIKGWMVMSPDVPRAHILKDLGHITGHILLHSAVLYGLFNPALGAFHNQTHDLWMVPPCRSPSRLASYHSHQTLTRIRQNVARVSACLKQHLDNLNIVALACVEKRGGPLPVNRVDFSPVFQQDPNNVVGAGSRGFVEQAPPPSILIRQIGIGAQLEKVAHHGCAWGRAVCVQFGAGGASHGGGGWRRDLQTDERTGRSLGC
ncbi:Polyunsaturated fatty acid lipoxygenase alox12, partial [Phlyctochytrium bullatum]